MVGSSNQSVPKMAIDQMPHHLGNFTWQWTTHCGEMMKYEAPERGEFQKGVEK